ncbi:MAG: zinc-binding dehydrogenase [Acidimicrobiia bacterium]
MRAVRGVSHQITVADVPEPMATADSVVVSIASAGICGSDLHMIDLFDAPLTFGHELAGRLADGTPVAIEPLQPCGVCAGCVAGDYHRCVIGVAAIFGVGRDGGMADKCLVPTRSLVPLSDSVALTDASLVEPLAVAAHGLRRGDVRPDERVAVIGGGALGQAVIAASIARGVTSLDAAVRHDRQRESAQRLGASLEVSDGYDVVIESAGTPSALAQAIEVCRPGGRVVIVGSYWDGNMGPVGMDMALKEINLIPSFMYSRTGDTRDIDVAASILAERPEIADAIITHRFPLDAAAEAFAVARDRQAGAIKVVLEP